MSNADRNRAAFARAVKRINKYVQGMVGATGDVVYQIAEEIVTDVKVARPGKGVPVDTGTLRATLKAVRTAPAQAEIMAGGPAAPYALVQHERTQYRHKIGEARYLVRGVERWKPGRARAELAANSDYAARYARGEI